jgi:hypothetical protein
MKKKILFSLLAMTASIFADGDVDSSIALAEESLVADSCKPKPPECKPKPPECKPKPKPKPCVPCVRPPVVTLATARPACGNGFYAFGDALFWHADIGDTDWAYVTNLNPPTATSTPGQFLNNHDVDFGWDWGYRVGLGINMDHDQWDSYVSYTFFRTDAKDHLTAAGGTIPVVVPVGPGIPVGGIVAQTSTTTGVASNGTAQGFNSAHIHWKIDFNMFDWDLGRWFYVSKSLSLRPHAGVKGGWIHQKVNQTFSLPATTARVATTQTIAATNDFWGVGAAGGLNTDWQLGTAGGTGNHRFAIFGDFAGALMYGHFHDKTISTTTVTATGADFSGASLSKGFNSNNAAAMLQAVLGLSWDVGFNNDKARFGLRAGYEFQYWFRQDRTLFFVFDVNGFGRYHRRANDLALQGLTIDVRFDF